MGESGSGKSTLAYGATRLLRAPAVITSGSVRYQGRRMETPVDVLQLSADQLVGMRWREISIVFQSAMNALNPVLNIHDQLTDVIRAHLPLSRAEATEKAAEPARPGRHPADATAQLPARAVGRHAPAGHDRDGAGHRP